MKESDNNVKLIVLDRLMALKEIKAHERVLQVMEVGTGNSCYSAVGLGFAGSPDGHSACAFISCIGGAQEDFGACVGSGQLQKCGGGVVFTVMSRLGEGIDSGVWLQVVMVLKKEVMNSTNGSGGESSVDNKDLASYRQCLVRTLHSCSIRFTSVAPAVVPLVSFGSFSVFVCDVLH